MLKTLKMIIFATLGVSLGALFLPQLQPWVILSWKGIENLYLWQFITYTFLEPGPFSLSFVLQLGFNMYILWIFGSSLLNRAGALLFLSLYFGSALLSGLAALFFPSFILAGSANAVYAIMVAWMMLNSTSQLLLFFTIPFKASWLIAGLIALTLFIHLSNGDWLSSATLAASVLYSYLFSLIAWRERGPFAFLYPFERKIFRLLEKRKQQSYHHSKIYDIKSGAPVLDDDQFMDAMLDQISRLGENSLTSAEKKRMKEISERKKK